MISRYSSKTPNENNHHANANKIFVTLLSVSSQDETAAEHIITFRTIAAKLTLITIVVFRVAQSVDRDRAVFGVLRERSPKYNPVFSHSQSFFSHFSSRHDHTHKSAADDHLRSKPRKSPNLHFSLADFFFLLKPPQPELMRCGITIPKLNCYNNLYRRRCRRRRLQRPR